MLERFTREHQRTSKGAAFNLEDEDELTHYGQNLSKFDDFDNVGLGLDDEEEEDRGQIDNSTVQKSHFGGFGDEEEEDDDDEVSISASPEPICAYPPLNSRNERDRRQRLCRRS